MWIRTTVRRNRPDRRRERAEYTLVLYHAAMVQAVCSGLVAGKMGSGSIRDGAKHVAVMLGIAYAVFLVVENLL